VRRPSAGFEGALLYKFTPVDKASSKSGCGWAISGIANGKVVLPIYTVDGERHCQQCCIVSQLLLLRQLLLRDVVLGLLVDAAAAVAAVIGCLRISRVSASAC
jgi:hypothetical protein